jgi:dihydroneopterin aldolase
VNHQDTVFVEDLAFSTKIGCSAEERAYPQPLKVSLEVECSLAGIKELDDGVCYDKLRKLVISLAENREWKLVEHFAEEIAEQVLQGFKAATGVSVTINKFIFSDCQSTGVKIYRTNS